MHYSELTKEQIAEARRHIAAGTFRDVIPMEHLEPGGSSEAAGPLSRVWALWLRVLAVHRWDATVEAALAVEIARDTARQTQKG